MDLFRRKSISSILEDATSGGGSDRQLRRNLNVRDLTALGIAAIIGAGIFSTIGNAASHGGPAVSLLFVFTAVACGFSALCYAQFASSIPIAGSAYTYAYASFGELIAWIIGWDLIMEYAIGNIAVAISWSEYFTSLLAGLGFHIPSYLGIDYLSAARGFKEVSVLLAGGTGWDSLMLYQQEAYTAWLSAPVVLGVRVILDLPAFCIVLFISSLVFIGIYESKVAGNIMVLLKLVILLAFIGVGAFYVQPGNWNPFAPNGVGGVLKGVAGVFFAYIGFDAISTTAEESRNPRRDLPRAMIGSLVITTILYVVIALVLTGMVHYSQLGVADPLAFAFERIGMTRFSGLIAFSAIIAMASVLLVFQIGQPRIWMSMSRDGLLPPIFSRIHRRFKTPWFSTIVTGFMVAIPSLFMNLTEVTDLTSIGTLFAFVLVSAGVLLIPRAQFSSGEGKTFLIPYYSSRYLLPLAWILVLFILFYTNSGGVKNALIPVSAGAGETAWEVLKHHLPTYLFVLVAIVVTVLGIIKKLSLIPVAGLLTNLYLMSELGVTNWMRFLVWLGIGLVLYFTYGYHHSGLKRHR
ncbi:MAG TPA: amino acid permease [Bacteroidales bacterium]|nr:amino acid permease [Bacteroidales bacterium]HSA42985.1 amino acid permease [Bacteroidales bacterium]